MTRACLDCRTLTNGPRCPTCTRRRKNRRNSEAATARAIINAHLAAHGPICPGWQREPHNVPTHDLTADHASQAFADGGTLHDGAQVLCRSCNARKGR